MKVCVVGESSADEAAVRILVDEIRGRRTEPIGPQPLRSRGWPSIVGIIRPVVRHLYYRTDAEGLALVVDSDTSPIHDAAHDQSSGCRFCLIRTKVDLARRELQPMSGRSMLKVAIGVAVPCIEAWLRCRADPRVGEAEWNRALQTGSLPYTTRALKKEVYGTDRPSLALETERAVEAAGRVAKILTQLEAQFPMGFGEFARSVRSW